MSEAGGVADEEGPTGFQGTSRAVLDQVGVSREPTRHTRWKSIESLETRQEVLHVGGEVLGPLTPQAHVEIVAFAHDPPVALEVLGEEKLRHLG
jgi:hypothetical protein